MYVMVTSATYTARKKLFTDWQRDCAQRAPQSGSMAHNQFLVIWKNDFSRTDRRQVSWLAVIFLIAFPVSQWLRLRRMMSFSAYSDEFAQASHLFPFYPLPPFGGKGTDCFIQFFILYPHTFTPVKKKGLRQIYNSLTTPLQLCDVLDEYGRYHGRELKKEA